MTTITSADFENAARKTAILKRELDITNADHIALWLDASTPLDNALSWLACRIVEAHEIEVAKAVKAAEARARLEGSKAMQARRKYPVLGTQGQAKVDWQFVEDHAKQAYENHRQTVERLAERGGLSWCELCAVVQDRKWSKMETADAIEQVRAAEARYLAALDPAQIAGGGE